jgi:hypothetical protein
MAHTKEYEKAYRQTAKRKSYKRNYEAGEKYKAWRRKYRKRIGNGDSHRYEKTPNGFLMRLYRNMQSRVTGVQKLKSHLYKGKELILREVFYEWAKSNETFWLMFRTWTESGYDRKLTPTVNRKNPKIGYRLDNIEWLTHSENSRLTSRNKMT